MRWLAVTGNAGHDWRIAKTIFADPSNNTLIQETTFEALNGKTVGDFNLYLLYKPYLKNVAANNNATDGRLRRQCLSGRKQRRRLRILRARRVARLDYAERRRHGVERLLRR